VASALLCPERERGGRLAGQKRRPSPDRPAFAALGRQVKAWQRLSTAFEHAHGLIREPRGRIVARAAGRTDVGRVRKQNEDAFVIADLSTGNQVIDLTGGRFSIGDRGVLLAVSDGMGGAAAGEIASALVVESLQQHMDRECRVEELLPALECAVEHANRDVWHASQSVGRHGMGATLVAVLLHKTFALVASVGDSRVYLIRGGRIRQITKDHSYVQMLVDAGVYSSEEAASSPYRNIILQAMGTKPDVTVGLRRLDLRRGDRFLLCSDGLSDKVIVADAVGEDLLRPSRDDVVGGCEIIQDFVLK
jgi:serine/threonine protein phosphatase PrpC